MRTRREKCRAIKMVETGILIWPYLTSLRKLVKNEAKEDEFFPRIIWEDNK